MKKKHTLSQYFVIACFLIFLLTAMLVTTFKPKEEVSFYENRNLAVKPEATVETLLNGEWGSAHEAYLADHTAGRKYMLALDTLINTYVYRQPIVNNVVVTKDCLMAKIDEWMQMTSDIPAQIDAVSKNIKSVNDLTESYGGSFYYVATPCQYVFHNDDYPWYVNNREDYTKLCMETLKTSMEDLGISYIDTGEAFAERNWDPSLSSAMDNHNSIRGAYVIYREIADRIQEDGKYPIDLLREGDYEIKELPNPYMGSYKRELVGLWDNGEKLSVLYPKKEIPFTRKDNGEPVEASVYKMPQTETQDVLYDLYMGGDIATTEINTNRPELPRVLIYGDSFTNAVECILYTGFDTMYSLDMRHCPESTLTEYIERYQPDIVICLRDYQAVVTAEGNGCGVVQK